MKLKWIALVAALAIPALAYWPSLHCKLPCGDACPFPCWIVH
jgi:hypothetical protein